MEERRDSPSSIVGLRARFNSSIVRWSCARPGAEDRARVSGFRSSGLGRWFVSRGLLSHHGRDGFQDRFEAASGVGGLIYVRVAAAVGMHD